MINLTRELVSTIAPRPSNPAKAQRWDAYVAMLTTGEAAAVLDRHKVSHKPVRLSMFLANVMHECGGLTIVREYMCYSAPRLMEVWPNWFRTLEFARQYERQPEKLANYIYGPSTTIGRNLGNTGANDGWSYRGGGLLQTTGRFSYKKFGQQIGIDLVNSPELIETPIHSLGASLGEWAAQRLNDYADRGEFMAVCNGINRGNPNASSPPIGWSDRKDWYQVCRRHIGMQPMMEMEGVGPLPRSPDADDPEFDERPRGRDTELPVMEYDAV